jgi:hypothetical protein
MNVFSVPKLVLIENVGTESMSVLSGYWGQKISIDHFGYTKHDLIFKQMWIIIDIASYDIFEILSHHTTFKTTCGCRAIFSNLWARFLKINFFWSKPEIEKTGFAHTFCYLTEPRP